MNFTYVCICLKYVGKKVTLVTQYTHKQINDNNRIRINWIKSYFSLYLPLFLPFFSFRFFCLLLSICLFLYLSLILLTFSCSICEFVFLFHLYFVQKKVFQKWFVFAPVECIINNYIANMNTYTCTHTHTQYVDFHTYTQNAINQNAKK